MLACFVAHLPVAACVCMYQITDFSNFLFNDQYANGIDMTLMKSAADYCIYMNLMLH